MTTYLVILTTIVFMLLLPASGCLKSCQLPSVRTVLLRMLRYIAYNPITLSLTIILLLTYLLVPLVDTREQIREEFGLPNESFLAYLSYAFQHFHVKHLSDNVLQLLLCGGIVERALGKKWFLAVILLTIPVGGYLTVLTAPWFVQSAWSDGDKSVGFSIADFCVLAFCICWLVTQLLQPVSFKPFTARQRPFPQESVERNLLKLVFRNPLGWSPRACQFVFLIICLILLVLGLEQGPSESRLAHVIGVLMGITVALVWLLFGRLRSCNPTSAPSP